MPTYYLPLSGRSLGEPGLASRFPLGFILVLGISSTDVTEPVVSKH